MIMRRFLLMSCLLVLLIGDSIAKNDKNDKKDKEEPSPPPSLMPTPLPSPQPSPGPTPKPSPGPTPKPSPGPTPKPSPGPTPRPSPGPTPRPVIITSAPSLALSTAPSETLIPSSSPSDIPSNIPSYLPTSTDSPSFTASRTPTSSAQPSRAPSATITKVNLPKMEVSFVVFGGTINKEALEEGMTSFFEELLVENQGILGNLSHVDLDVLITNGRRLQESRLSASVEGVASFEGREVPSEARLSQVFRSYFSSWGDIDLEERLSTDEARVDAVLIFLNGELVTQNNPSQALEEKAIGGSNLSTGLLVGVVVAAASLFTAIALVVWQRMRFKKQEQLAETPMTSPAKSDRSVKDALPDTAPRNLFVGDEISLPGGFSLDGESLYTTSSPLTQEDLVYTSPADLATLHEKMYDAKRLDRVISIAHEDVGERSSDSDSEDEFRQDFET